MTLFSATILSGEHVDICFPSADVRYKIWFRYEEHFAIKNQELGGRYVQLIPEIPAACIVRIYTLM